MILIQSAHAFEVARLKDIGRIDGWRENHLIGFGVVTGLAGTGDSARSKATRQSLANLMSNFDMTVALDQINSRNVAVVSMMASLPPITQPGDKVDVVVTSLGDARSLVGGTLLLAPLKGADGNVYALAQGAVTVGGYFYEQNGTVTQKNHPTVGTISGGAQIEADISSGPVRSDGTFDFILSLPDYTTARRIALAINAEFKNELARVKNQGAVSVRLPSEVENPANFLAALENIEVIPDVQARVVINERSGTIVAGENVRISKVTVAHGNLRLSIVTDYAVSQPIIFGRINDNTNIRTEVIPSTRINVDEDEGGVVELSGGSTVADLIRALHKVKVSTRDVITILQSIKAAGALHAELIIQ